MIRKLIAPAVAAALLAGCPAAEEDPSADPTPGATDSSVSLIQFGSCTDLSEHVADAWLESLIQSRYSGWYGFDLGAEDGANADPSGGDEGPSDYSETNTQEDGVDEPDLVKTDGDYIYVVERGSLWVVDSWPADEANIIAQLPFDTEQGSPSSMFLDGDRLAVFSNAWDVFDQDTDWRYGSGTRVTIVDIADRTNPQVLRELNVEGWFVDARMVGDDIYMVTNTYMGMPQELWNILWDDTLGLPEFDYEATEAEQEATRDQARQMLEPYVDAMVATIDVEDLLPRVRDDIGGVPGAQQPLVDCDDVYHPQQLSRPSALSVVHVDLGEGDHGSAATATSLLAEGWTVYASRENLYVSQGSRWWWWGWGPLEMNTHIHQFELTGDSAVYQASGSVPGWLHNQFSLGEYDGYLRVATTQFDWWWGTSDAEDQDNGNNVFVMRKAGDELVTVGEVTGIAPGERITAARFLGDRGYMVTFRNMDPLFTIDLSDPYQPTLMGELEITGFSSYLHPLDDDHLLTVGMEGNEDGQITGLAISIFDVSDFANPTLAHRYVVTSDDWSWSEALWNHHAFTFHRDVLALPIYTWENGVGFSGMLAVAVDAQAGLTELGRVSHEDMVLDSECRWGDSSTCDDNYWYAWMRRSVAIEDNLFSLSDYGIKVNELEAPDNELARMLYFPL